MCVKSRSFTAHELLSKNWTSCFETGQAVLKLDTNVAHDFDQMRIK